MADSIAKLSVIITGDASPLGTELQRSDRMMRSFASSAGDPFARGLDVMRQQQDKWAAGMERMRTIAVGGPFDSLRVGAQKFIPAAEQAATAAQKFGLAARAMHMSGLHSLGTITSMTGALTRFASVGSLVRVGGPALALAGITAGAFGAASAADSVKTKFGEMDTWANSTKRLNAELAKTKESFATIFSPLSEFASEATDAAAKRLAQFNEWGKTDAYRELEAKKASADAAVRAAAAKELEAKAAAKVAAEEAKIAKARAEAEAKRRDEMSDYMRSQFSRADAIKDSVRTPMESLKRDLTELQSMFAGGWIDDTTMTRAADAALKRMKDAKASMDRAQDQADRGAAAVERFTPAGFSAAQGGLREMQRLEKLQEQANKIAQDEVEASKEIADILRNQKPVVLQEGNF